MSFLKTLPAKLAAFLVVYGGWGLFAISFLDSSFVSLPLVNDLLLIHLASQRPGRAPIYAVACTVGSVLGACLMYAIARRAGELVRRRRHPTESSSRVRQWLARNEFVVILMASLLPPPAPFKLFALAAGALRVNPVTFGVALMAGRGLRFALDAALGIRYGQRAEAYLRNNPGPVSLAAIATIVVLSAVYRWAVNGNSIERDSQEQR